MPPSRTPRNRFPPPFPSTPIGSTRRSPSTSASAGARRSRGPPRTAARRGSPPATVQLAMRLYLRFTLSDRDVEELLAERGLEVSYETVRRWLPQFGPAFARNPPRLRPRPSRPPRALPRAAPARGPEVRARRRPQPPPPPAKAQTSVALGRDGDLDPGPA